MTRARFLVSVLPLLIPVLSAQVVVTYTPEPMAVLSVLHVRNVGLWAVRACNNSPQPVTIPPERIYMAAPGIRLITPMRARAVVAQGMGRSRKAIVAEWITYGLIGATALTGFGPVAASKTVITGLALGSSLGIGIQRKLEGSQPSPDALLDLLDQPIVLGPAACATRSALAAKMKNPQSVGATLILP